MKTIDQIKANPRIAIGARGDDGFSGIISMPTWKGTFICSVGAGWEHVSVSPSRHRIVPSWDDMCRTKEIFWKDDEACDAYQGDYKMDEKTGNIVICKKHTART